MMHLSAGEDRFFDLQVSGDGASRLVLLVLPMLWDVMTVVLGLCRCTSICLELRAADFLTEQSANW